MSFYVLQQKFEESVLFCVLKVLVCFTALVVLTGEKEAVSCSFK